MPIFSDINFGRAFDIRGPVIQGNTEELDSKLLRDDLLDTMGFCKGVLAPTQPEMVESVAKRYPTLFGEDAPVLTVIKVEGLTQIDATTVDEEARDVLLRHNTRKMVDAMFDGTRQFGSEVLGELFASLQRGHLGLVHA